MDTTLTIPPESRELKTEVKRLRDLLAGPGVAWDPLAVWYGNKIPKYLWDHWKGDLKLRGFTWQTFLKLLRHRTDGAVLWFYGELDWETFVRQTIELIDGPLGDRISKGQKRRLRK